MSKHKRSGPVSRKHRKGDSHHPFSKIKTTRGKLQPNMRRLKILGH